MNISFHQIRKLALRIFHFHVLWIEIVGIAVDPLALVFRTNDQTLPLTLRRDGRISCSGCVGFCVRVHILSLGIRLLRFRSRLFLRSRTHNEHDAQCNPHQLCFHRNSPWRESTRILSRAVNRCRLRFCLNAVIPTEAEGPLRRLSVRDEGFAPSSRHEAFLARVHVTRIRSKGGPSCISRH